MFSFNKRSEILALENEISLLKARNEALETELSQVSNVTQSKDQQYLDTQAEYENQNELNKLWLQSSDLISQIREALAASSTELLEHRDNFQSSHQLFDQIMAMLQQNITSTSQIATDTEKASVSVDQLKTVTAGINDFVNIIKGISDQTNLLALNAAIEAARAGEQGRGFAVVADEVRTLAQRSAEASNEISNLIDQVNQQMTDVIDGIHHVGNKSQEISDSTASIEETANKIVNMSQNMYGVITNSTSDAFIQTVKMDHVVWKLEVYQVMLGQSDKSIEDFADHTMCRLGKWYYQGEGANKYASMTAFKQIDKPHAEVHQYGLDALKAFSAGDNKHTVQSLAKMENASFKVVDLLTSLSHEISKGVGCN
ncbi:methyl-accepting chemotaxis protein [Litorilituus lipolyticus]|nr:methyl-accepting chemotaxis protein [Litorilituus lipolyticus]